MSYLENVFTSKINRKIKTIVELGSRDIIDAIALSKYYDATVYAFECNPDCLELCYKNFSTLDAHLQEKINIVPSAVTEDNGPITFYPFDKEKYDNIGASSMFKIDFSKRNSDDPDYGKPSPQKEITVSGIRMDTFLHNNYINKVDLLCMDLQGYELAALKSFGERIKDIHYLITEAAINSTYIGGTCFKDLKAYLESYGFEFVCHNRPHINVYSQIAGFSEFDCMFINTRFKD